MKCTLAALVIATAIARSGRADADPAMANLEKALPPGWSMLETDSELVIRHDRPCYRTGEHVDDEPPDAANKPAVKSKGDGALVTIELRYRIEPKWSPQQVDAAKLANDRVADDLKALRAQYQIDAIKLSRGRPLPATPEERAHLEAYEKAESVAKARLVRLPLCALGDQSVFDGDETYAPLRHKVDPPEALREANAIVSLVKQRCGAK